PPNRKSIEDMRRNCLPLLRGELEDLRPNRVIAMGRYASASLCELLGLDPPRDQRGITKTEVGEKEIFFTPHPNYLFRFERDLAGEIRKILLG
ncbi:MAG: uracil-DNA glycosylase family protein, partial [Hadesarchaea archaeon]|nr:uracil-DNA glycosylase family protein [Hadesarchaea archaeon]